MHPMSTVAIIPARGGSRGLPGKHLRLLGGEPLIVHTIRAASGADRVDRVVVSTDDPSIARVSQRAGAEVPFLRPVALARDETPTQPVVAHAVEWLEARGERVDLVVTLQPTSPLRGSDEIDAAIGLLDDASVDSAVSVAATDLPLSVLGQLQGDRFVALAPAADARRQAVAQAHRITGGVYVTRRRLLAAGRLLGDRPAALVVPPETAVDVDTADDLAVARRLIRSVR
jgi:CMP-N,N'-diacetyllegionaminic acid synthase